MALSGEARMNLLASAIHEHITLPSGPLDVYGAGIKTVLLCLALLPAAIGLPWLLGVHHKVVGWIGRRGIQDTEIVFHILKYRGRFNLIVYKL